MAHLSSIERRKLEQLFRMDRGYVLDFTDMPRHRHPFL